MAKKYDLEDRLVSFAANTAVFCKGLPSDFIGQYYSGQLLRSSGSSALNFGEAQGTNTDKDYVNKCGIGLKELKESRVHLKILSKLNYDSEPTRNNLLGEMEELIKIMNSS